MNFQEKLVDAYMDRAVREFNTNPLALGFLRRLAGEAPGLFFPAAMNRLKSAEYSDGHRFLTVLAMKHEEALEWLVDPTRSTTEVSLRLFKRFLSVDPSFDVRLARQLPDRGYSNHATAFDAVRSTRALGILDETSPGRRLLPILGHLPESSDNVLAAKATLFVGRRVMNPAWTLKLMSSAEQRVRASAVETLWGLTTPAATELLEKCVHDRNNRVQGNALIGLHIAGHPAVDAGLSSLARSGNAASRATAAWAMGKIAQERWIVPLSTLLRDDSPHVRSVALRSLMEIRRQETTIPDVQTDAAQDLPNILLTGEHESTGHADLVSRPPLVERRLPELRLDGSTFRTRGTSRLGDRRFTM